MRSVITKPTTACALQQNHKEVSKPHPVRVEADQGVICRLGLSPAQSTLLPTLDNSVGNAIGARDQGITPRYYWTDMSNQLALFNDIGKDLKVKTLDDWYTTTSREVCRHGGSNVLAWYYNKSLVECLMHVYPSFKWIKSRFKGIPRNHWRDTAHQKEVLDSVAQSLSIKDLSQWQSISLRDIKDNTCKRIIKKLFDSSLWACLSLLYPSQKFMPWQFDENGRYKMGYWHKPEHQRSFLFVIKKTFNISAVEDWYRISHQHIRDIGGRGIIEHWPNALSLIDPLYNWEWSRFSGIGTRFKQRLLFEKVNSLFPTNIIVEEHKIDFSGFNKEGITVDIYLPELKLAFEYQGEQHYRDGVFFSDQYSVVQGSRDLSKLQHCSDVGISLVPIPYWWDGLMPSLVATIQHYAPNIGERLDAIIGTALISEPAPCFRTKLMFPHHNRNVNVV